MKCGKSPQAMLANTPLNTVPFPICKLIKPDISVVFVWVSLYTDELTYWPGKYGDF